MEIIFEFISNFDWTDAISAGAALVATLILKGVKKTKTELDDQFVEKLADKIVEKAKDEN